MKIRFAQQHNNVAGLTDLLYEPTLTKNLDFQAEYTANGVAKKIGGGTMQVRWQYLERDELDALLAQLGVTQDEPSTEGTFLVPDWSRVYNIMNGQITIKTPDEANGYFSNIIADITGLAYT